MKRILVPLLLLFCVSCGWLDRQDTPEGYVRHAVRLLDAQALYANTPEWSACRKEVLSQAKSFTSMEQAREAVSWAASAAGGKHSALVPPVRDTASYPETIPEARVLENNVLYVLLPPHSGVLVSDSLYIHTILNFLQEHLDAKGVVLDLRGNHGGNMYPMIAAVSPLLPDGIIIRFKSRKRTSPISLGFVLSSAQLSPNSVQRFPKETPIAILTDEWTGSSGEATLLCFRGMESARSFGTPTAGYASANMPHPLADGYTLVITTASNVARTGEEFCEDPIEPDVRSEAPLQDALAWIHDRI